MIEKLHSKQQGSEILVFKIHMLVMNRISPGGSAPKNNLIFDIFSTFPFEYNDFLKMVYKFEYMVVIHRQTVHFQSDDILSTDGEI